MNRSWTVGEDQEKEGPFPERKQCVKMHDLVKDSKYPRIAGSYGVKVEFCWIHRLGLNCSSDML